MVASLTNQKDSLIGLADDFGGGDIVIEWNYRIPENIFNANEAWNKNRLISN